MKTLNAPSCFLFATAALLTLGTSVGLASECRTEVLHEQARSHFAGSYPTEGIVLAERILSEKGYEIVYQNAEYQVVIEAAWEGGVEGWEGPGDSYGSAYLTDLATEKTIAWRDLSSKGAARIFGIGRKAKALSVLRNALSQLPDCEDLRK